MRAFFLGNETTKGVEIVFEGSNPGLTNPFANLKNWIKDWSNNSRNLKSKEAKNLIRTAEYSKSYEDALKITREVQNEYKNGKGGYKGLTMKV